MSQVTQNRISATLSQQDITAIQTAIQTIKDRMPFLISLTPKERKVLPRINQANKLFVANALSSAKRNPELMPNFFNVDEAHKDYTLFEQLQDIQNAFAHLSEQLTDARVLAGAEAYNAMLGYYQMCKLGAKTGVPGAKTEFENLKTRFETHNRYNQEAQEEEQRDME